MKVEIYNKIKDCPGKMHSWYESSLGYPIRKPNNYKGIKNENNVRPENTNETRQEKTEISSIKEKAEVVEIKQTNMNKLLFFLPADSKWSRIIRRFVVVFLLAGISGIGVEVVQNSGSYIPAIWLPLITALLVSLDKMIREFLAKE